MYPELEKIKTQKRRNTLLLRLVLLLMAISTVSLIFFQAKFIHTSSKTEESLFRLKVFDSAEEIVEILEKEQQRFNENPALFSALLNVRLKNILKSKGIEKIPYYELRTASPKNKIICKGNISFRQKKGSTYEYSFLSKNLMPGETLSLVLSFPQKQNFMQRKTNTLFVLSVILILILAGGFAYSLKIIFKQKELSKMKNDFINNMTHEIKTPISTISLACEALSDPMVDASLSEQYLKIIAEENKRLQNMVEQLLQHAKLEEGILSLKLEEIDMHELIRQAVNNAGLGIESRNGKILQNLAATKFILIGDRMHLSNIIYNLLDNAGKYTEGTPIIKIETKNTENGIEIDVKDNGIGIPKAEQGKIFDKFYRVSTGDIHNVKGYGIGLSYVKQIVAMHKGTISLESEPEKGSTFKIFLPFVPIEKNL